MRLLQAGLVVIAVFVAAACNSPSTSTGQDLSMNRVDLSTKSSACGHSGDIGNSLGVGMYCELFAECANNSKATICSSIQNTGGPNDTYFCTMPCAGVTDVTTCGTNASCACQGGQCGCTPDACLSHD